MNEQTPQCPLNTSTIIPIFMNIIMVYNVNNLCLIIKT